MKAFAQFSSKRLPITSVLVAGLFSWGAQAATSYYWDTNGATAGSGGNTPSGSWESAFWSTSSAGTAATANWIEGGFPRFAAGSDAKGNYTITANSNHTIAGAFIVGSGGAGQTITISGTGALTIDPTGGPEQGFFGQSSTFLVINNRLTGAGGVIAQSGQLFLNGSNDYSGGTTPGGGLINFNNPHSFGSSNLFITVSGSALIAEGAAAINISNNWTVTLNAALNCVGNTAGITYSGNIGLGTNTLNLGCGGNVANIDIFSGTISGTGGIGRSPGQSPAGIIKFTGPNTYTGKTTLQSGITYATVLNSVFSPAQQASGSFGVPSDLTTGTISIGATTIPATLVYAGAGETTDRPIDLGGTTGGATIENDGTGPLYFTSSFTTSGSGAKTLTLQGSNTGTNTIGGSIGDSTAATSLTKAQNGLWILSGNNTYTGNTAVSAGTLVIGGAGDLGGGNYLGNISVSGVLSYGSSTIQNFGGVLSGNGELLVFSSGELSLSGTNTFTGKVVIQGGYLALNAGGSLSAATGIMLTPGANFDVSGLSSTTYTLGSNAMFIAQGSATSSSTIDTATGGTVDFGSRPIGLSFAPTTFTGDQLHPALNIIPGTAAFNNNTFTVTNASGTPLGEGTYTLIACNGNITGTPNPVVVVQGAGCAPGFGGVIQVNANEVDLVVLPLPMFSNLTASQSIVYGTPSISLSGTVIYTNNIGIGYPAMGETVYVTINGSVQTTTTSDSTGDFSITYNTATLPFFATSYTITYGYSGDASFSSAVDTSTTLAVTKAPLTVTANNQSKTYGQAMTFAAGSTNFSSSGLLNGQTIGSVTLAVSGSGGATNAAVSGSPYTITPSAATGGTFSAANYSITYNTGLLTVNPAPLTVTANNASRAFGAPNPAFTASYTNFVNGQTLATSDVHGTPLMVAGADTNSDLGVYIITNSLGTLTSTNYSFVFVNGALTVTNTISGVTLVASSNPALPATPVTFSAILSTRPPSLAVPTNVVQFVIDGVPFGGPVSPTNGVAAIATSTLTHGNHTIEADYAGDTNTFGATLITGSTNSMNELINTPPVAGPASFGRQQDLPLQIPIAALMANASDADGDPFGLSSVSALSTNGAAISTNATMVTYQPGSTNANVTDTFTYTVKDSFGATTLGTVTVTIIPNSPAVSITSVANQPGGGKLLSFSGVPNFVYLIEAATNITSPMNWTIISTNTADTNGLFQFLDSNATNYPSRFYRTAIP